MKTVILLLLACLASAWALLVAHPDLYYGQKADYRNFTLHASGQLPTGTEAVLDRVLDHLAGTEFYTPEKKIDVYLPASRGEFLFFAPLQSGERLRLNPFTGCIFIAAADFAADKALRAPGDADYTSLTYELASLSARELARRTMQPLTYLVISEWKIAGYGEKVSGGSGAFNPSDICGGQPASPALKAYEYGQAVDFVMREESVPASALFDKSYSYESVDRRLKDRVCGH